MIIVFRQTVRQWIVIHILKKEENQYTTKVVHMTHEHVLGLLKPLFE